MPLARVPGLACAKAFSKLAEEGDGRDAEIIDRDAYDDVLERIRDTLAGHGLETQAVDPNRAIRWVLAGLVWVDGRIFCRDRMPRDMKDIRGDVDDSWFESTLHATDISQLRERGCPPRSGTTHPPTAVQTRGRLLPGAAARSPGRVAAGELTMAERIRFHFDPVCPWCYLTARWVDRLQSLGEVEADWAVFSLGLVNGKGRGASEQALRIAIAVRHRHGQQACGRFYLALGARVHEGGAAVDDPEVIAAALRDVGVEPALCEQAQAHEDTWNEVVAEHDRLVERTRSFGVPTIVLDGGDGPAIFGPVISEAPGDEDAVELFRHVAWLTRCETFSELKRDRTVDPDVESFRRWRSRRQAD